jgi:hypothetical protein
MKAIIYSLLLLLFAPACTLREDNSPGTVRHQFVHPPQRAAACFARNAEEHSSALVAEVRPPDRQGRVEVIVRVKNGVTYATAELRPVGERADGTITLMVISRRGNRQLVDSLVEGC